MKLIILLLTTAILQVSASSYGQNVTLKRANVPLQSVLNDISKQTGFDFFYSDEALKNTKPVSIDLNNIAIEKALELCFKNQPLTYTIRNKFVTVKEAEPSFLETVISTVRRNLADTDVRGRVVDESGKPLPSASIRVKGKDAVINTNDKGEFVLKGVSDDAVLIISYVGYKQLEIPLKGAVMPLEIKLNQVTGELEEVSVKGNTGYQVIDKNHPGSFDVVDNKLLNRTISGNILDRIENVTPGISFKNAKDGILIRGRNSIFSNVNPLIVVDNFPYDGSIDNINPNDVESVTVLKDAAAAAIWGARAGNGVIVITTKRGKSTTPSVEVVSNLTVQDKPDLFGMPTMSSADYIDNEIFIFDKGFYNGRLNARIAPAALTPVVEILDRKRKGIISSDEATASINLLTKNDVRNDLLNHFYRNGTIIQNGVNVSENDGNINYFLSAGLDRNTSDLVGASGNKFTIRSQSSFKLGKRAELGAGVVYTKITNNRGNNPGMAMNIGPGISTLYPYADLVDENGKALRISKNFRDIYADTLGRGKLKSLSYYPLDEINYTSNGSKLTDFLINTQGTYKILSNLKLSLNYQYENQISTAINNQFLESYETRYLINQFYQPNAQNKYPYPVGDKLSTNINETNSHQGRVQLFYQQDYGKHNLSILLGSEAKQVVVNGNSSTMFGYNEQGNSVTSSINFDMDYRTFYNGSLSKISNPISISRFTERSLSYYANFLYNYDNKYMVSGSARNESANLFGVRTNMQSVPLWSIGTAWNIHNEHWYKIDWLPHLKLSLTYGYSGIFSRAASGDVVITYAPVDNAGIRFANIKNAPNEKLRWERDGIMNLALDFGLRSNIISGKFEYYRKNNKDLMGFAPADPTLGLQSSGISQYFANVASVKGHGIDFQLNTRNLNGTVKWTTSALFSYALTNVSDYLVPFPQNSTNYINDGVIKPIIGKPIYTVYSYKWGGLDADTGNPIGYLGDNRSMNYSSLTAKTKPDSLIYNGPQQPPFFGAFRNAFQWKNIMLSANISYKFGFFVRRKSINYESLNLLGVGHSDYTDRWKASGDELHTNVPSRIYPANTSREEFYRASQILVEKGDHIRLADIRVDYTLSKHSLRKLPVNQINLFVLATNLGFLWRANKNEIDPELPDTSTPAPGKRISFGIQLKL